MIDRYDSLIVTFVTRLIVPFIQVFALYVIAHGHFSPGGGFQGGAILAASGLLVRLSLGQPVVRWLTHDRMRRLGAVGLLIFAGAGIVPLFFGSAYLDYSGLPLPFLSDAALRATGILIVEIGIAMAVLGILLTIFDHLAGWEW